MSTTGSLDAMQIGTKGIGDALHTHQLAVPVYQRSYAWTKKEVNELFQDIDHAIRTQEPEYFLGSIVVARKNPERPEVVDGQQRLATTIILLSAIRDHFHRTGDTSRARDIEAEYLQKKHLRTQEVEPKMRLNETDNDFFIKRVISSPDSQDRLIEAGLAASHKRIEEAAALAKATVARIANTAKPADALIDWIDFIRDRVKVIWVSVPDYANAFTIFETLNDRGLDLATSDLLKNFLFGESKDRISEAIHNWMIMTGTLEAVGSDAMTVTYIKHFWSSTYGVTREKELYSAIKSKITSKQSAIELSQELANNARLYAAILNTDHEIWHGPGSETSRHMAALNEFGLTQVRPLLMAILDKFDVSEIRRSFRLLVNWGVRFLICGGSGSGSLETAFCERSKQIRQGDIRTAQQLLRAMNGIVPNDIFFRQSFTAATVTKNYLARYYLRVLECQNKGNVNQSLVPNSNEHIINLEHILPERPSEFWSSFDEDTAKAYFRHLGNMVLLESDVNSNIGNAKFADKVSAYKDSEFSLTQSVGQNTTWEPTDIESRQATLASLAVLAWSNKVV